MDPRAAAAPIVRTPSGRVRGTWEHPRVAAFRGIPYAAPPIGALRFAAPEPRRPWTGVLDATRFGPTPQRGAAEATLIPELSIAGDDTLSVNVWTPSLDAGAGLPVVVWIHGGGFISGSPASPWYDGAAFARDGVVLVTLSYRLGFTGFGWIEGAEPNRGVLDWICALAWVRDHIAVFGGDPQRVTIAGQSAGGAAVLALLGAPGAAGLFHGAYAMSPAIANPSAEAARERGARFAELAGVAPDLAGVSGLSEARILDLQPRIALPGPPHLIEEVHRLLRDGLLLGPVVDGRVVVADVTTAVAAGRGADVPLVIGTTEDELAGHFQPGGLVDLLPRRALLRALGASAQAAERWLETSPARAIESTRALLGRYATEAVFHSWVPRLVGARAAAATAGPTWSYRFAWHGEAPAYAGHCSDLPFLFDRLDAPGVAAVAGERPPQELATAVHGALVAFARDGDPGWAPNRSSLGPTHVFDAPERNEWDVYASARLLAPPQS